MVRPKTRLRSAPSTRPTVAINDLRIPKKTATQGATTSNRAVSEEPASGGESALHDVQSKEARTRAPGL